MHKGLQAAVSALTLVCADGKSTSWHDYWLEPRPGRLHAHALQIGRKLQEEVRKEDGLEIAEMMTRLWVASQLLLAAPSRVGA